MTAKISAETLQTFLHDHPDWSEVDGRLRREFVFGDFVEAFGFMTRAAILAERANHHPQWCNVYKKVNVDLTTHEAGGLTRKDLDLAAEMDQAAG